LLIKKTSAIDFSAVNKKAQHLSQSIERLYRLAGQDDLSRANAQTELIAAIYT